MISVPIPELKSASWSLRYENGKYYMDRQYKKSNYPLPREYLANYPEQLKIIDRKLKLQKLLEK